jgi:hypothetical protein
MLESRINPENKENTNMLIIEKYIKLDRQRAAGILERIVRDERFGSGMRKSCDELLRKIRR